MGSKGFWGVIILLFVAVLWSFLTGPAKISQMEQAIQTELNNAGYSNFAAVSMSGNVATLTGTAPNEAAVTDVVNVAKNTKCPFCKKKDKAWHEVNNQLEFDTLPMQSPFTFSGQKNSDGRVSLTGFVESEAAKKSVMTKAQSLFGANLASASINIAKGAPNDSWSDIVETDMEQLALLETGRFVMEGSSNFIGGTSDDAAIRDRINASGANMPSGYEFAANISVDGIAAQNVGQVRSESVCQALFDDLKSGKSVLFETAKADIKGAGSFDLLNSLASAANQCASFRIAIEGHTDNVGDDAANQNLSQLRANAVMAYLRDNNVKAERMTARGFGETQPVATNETPSGRASNRRIEFTVTQSQ